MGDLYGAAAATSGVRRRFIAIVGTAGCVAAIGISGCSTHDGPASEQPAAAHVLSWAAQDVGQQHLVEYARIDALGAGNRPTGLYQLTWTYGIEGTLNPGMTRTVVFYRGKPQAEYAMTWGHGKSTVTAVDYVTRTWEHRSGADLGEVASAVPRNCSSDLAPGDLPEFLHSGLRCTHELRIVGAARVDGVRAIKIVTVYRQPSGSTDDFWVNPQTYLPVRQLLETGAMLGFPGAVTREQTDYQWLTPTAANLAEVAVQIPAGFRWDSGPSANLLYTCSFVWGYVNCN